MEFRILGALEVETGGRLIDVGTARQRGLFALLLLRAGEPVPTERLAEELWSGNPPRTARHTVQTYIHRLRRALGGQAHRLQTCEHAYRLEVTAGQLDASRFEELAEQGRQALAAADPDKAAGLLSAALGLWRGPVLSDLVDLEAAQPARARLEGLRVAALEDRIEADLALGRHAPLVAELEGLVCEQPFRERMWGQLMLALYRCGRQADALAAFQRARTVLGEELGLEPGPWLERLQGRILLQEPGLDVPRAAPSRPPVDSLPVVRTSFVGRRRELAELQGLLALRRLVTITGPPGSGKTRLAIEAARTDASRHPHGRFFVSLTEVTDPALVPAAIAATLGVPATEQPVLATLVDRLRSRRLLLVLDNFEHLLDAAAVVTQLLDAAPGLTVLATSRAPLRLSGEQEYRLGPLPIPSSEDVSADPTAVDALVLFADRARAVDAGFALTGDTSTLVAHVVRRVDRLPLAIELAAARLRLFPLAELAGRLDPALPQLTQGPVDHPSRQRTLRDAIAWSHDLLASSERAVFRRLAVFRGGFTLEAAAAVAAGPPVEDVTESISTLVDACLVERPVTSGPARFAMLETIREYALEQLETAGEDARAGRCHSKFYCGLAEQAEPELTGPQRSAWLARLTGEHPNLRAALAWTRDSGTAELGMRLAGSMWRFWQFTGQLAEGRYWLQELLDAGEDASARARARALLGLAGICFWQVDGRAAAARYQEALDLAEHLDDWGLHAEALWGRLSTLAALLGRLPEARVLERQFLSLAERHPELGPMTNAVSGTIRLFSGDFEGARAYAEAALATHGEADGSFMAGEAARAVGHISFLQGQHQEAEDKLRQALRADRDANNLTGVVTDLNWLGRVAVARGQPDTGVVLAGAASRLQETAGGGFSVQAFALDIDLEAPQAVARHTLTDSRIEHAWNRGRTISLDDAIALALIPREETIP